MSSDGKAISGRRSDGHALSGHVNQVNGGFGVNADRDARVIGLTGGFGSGCTTAAKLLRDKANSRLLSLSEEIKAEWKSRSSGKQPTRRDLQRLGDELRESEGAGTLIERVLEGEQLSEGPPASHIVIDGIRNLGEVIRLRQEFGYRFTLMAIASTSLDRWERIGSSEYVDRGLSESDFLDDDKRDRNEETEYGQQVELCIDAADVLVCNTSDVTLTKFRRSVLELARLAIGEKKRPATPDEIHMHMAFSSRFTSKCIKRNVGAVIVDSHGEVVGVGYNENPLGTKPCIEEEEYGLNCYRDIVRNRHFAQLSAEEARCPACGIQIPHIEGPPWRCPACFADGKKTNLEAYFFPDRAMSWCTAVHAEDRAIWAAGERARGCTLYTTTHPCFQCAEKLTNAGIREVCFTETYPDELSVDRLELAGIKTRQFEGVRSAAFERIFSEKAL